MTRFFTVILLVVSLAGYCQKNRNKQPAGNYLRREQQEPPTWFTLCGRKNEMKVRLSDLAAAPGIKLSSRLDGRDIVGMDVELRGEINEKFSTPDQKFSPEIKDRLAGITKRRGNSIVIYLKVRNRSTQVVNVLPKHVFYIYL